MEYSVLECTEFGIKIIPGGSDIWMTKHEIAGLFGCFIAKVNANIRSILKAGVLDESTVCRRHNYSDDGFVELYNLEMIIALSFRIQSRNADLFRQYIMKKAVADTSTVPQPVLMVRYWNTGSIFPN